MSFKADTYNLCENCRVVYCWNRCYIY